MLHDKANELDESRSHSERLSRWLGPTINVLYAFSATLGQGVELVSLNWLTVAVSSFSQVFSPANIISAGIGVLFLVRIFL